jgi:predicted N-formylglutamate amidohydrolase
VNVGQQSLAISPKYIVAVHSFTPNYEGNLREIEIGLLYNRHGEMAEKLQKCLVDKGYKVGMNQPYSGMDGMPAVDALVEAIWPISRIGITFEFRNDIISTPEQRERVVNNIVEAFDKVGITNPAQ